ncbi:MAG: YsnF/AvaK domain-containing protein [Pseudomonadota bacterium]|nr:YsnF/AvaK domain-containing protein [Pseudomonadota bacterium]
MFRSPPEAEAARKRLASDVEVEWSRMLTRDTAAPLDDLKLEPKQAKVYREALLRGDHLLVAKVARGEDPKRVVRALSEPGEAEADLVEAQLSYAVESPESSPAEQVDTATKPSADDVRVAETTPPAPPPAVAGDSDEWRRAEEPAEIKASVREPEVPVAKNPAERERLQVGEPEVVRAGAGLEPVPAAPIGNQAPGRRVSYAEVEALGLLKDRTIEVVEMREEPVIAKEVFVREEVIVRKTISERTETIRDSVRRTQVEVEDLSGSRADR